MDTDGMSDRPDLTRPVTIQVPVYALDYGVTRSWPTDHPLSIRVHAGEVVIEGDKIALRALAELLLTLSEPDTPSSFHFHLEASAGELTPDSVNLTLDHDEWDE
jgi:hypothetical protein